ncbi:MAG: hypothetical protein DRH12_08215 [Deltaproteobacteria bacterium]|nr:MAG: hypothetical protein DRH12_08215 [Deltaproteobacteria bacterium]RLB84675.1 MAG: hypothetical protein DRH15_04410 [Deltaproteobacteria bacterium]
MGKFRPRATNVRRKKPILQDRQDRSAYFPQNMLRRCQEYSWNPAVTIVKSGPGDRGKIDMGI